MWFEFREDIEYNAPAKRKSFGRDNFREQLIEFPVIPASTYRDAEGFHISEQKKKQTKLEIYIGESERRRTPPRRANIFRSYNGNSYWNCVEQWWSVSCSFHYCIWPGDTKR